MTNEDEIVYASKPSWRSLWRQYRIHRNRIELRSLLGTKVIPADEILDVEVRPPIVIGDIFRGKTLAYCWALKLDMADLCQHVAIRRRAGIMKRLRFAPDDPEKFVEVCKSIMKKVE